MMYIPHAMANEKSFGTVRYFFFFIWSNLLINSLYVLICYCLHFEYPGAYKMPAYHLIALFLAELVVSANREPEAARGYY